MRSTSMLLAISALLVFALSSLPSSEASGRSVTRALLSTDNADVVDDDATVRWWSNQHHKSGKPGKEKTKTMKSGWFVAQNIAVSGGPNYEDCNGACARYTQILQAQGFSGALMCTDAALDVMGSVVDEDTMQAALDDLSDYSDPFPTPNPVITENTGSLNGVPVSLASPYFFTTAAPAPTEATYFPDNADRLPPKCNNAFQNNDDRVNRYCFCEYVNTCKKV